MRKAALLPLLLLLPLLSASAQSPNYGSGFTSTGLTLNGGATISGTHLRLTDGAGSEARSAFFSTPVNVQSFTNNFTFQLTNANADGFTFTIQGVGPTALGWGGGGLGYRTINNSIAVGFQLYSSVLGYKEVSLTGDWTNGAAPDATPGSDTTGSGVSLHSGDVMSVHMTYDGTTLTWTITDTTTNKTFTKSVNINIPALTGNTAYVGFTGGEGGLTAVQDVLTWTYTAGSNSPVPPSITTQPANQTVTVGQTATFSVVATGTAPLTYQWLQNTGSGFTNISGATSSSYTTPATTSTDNGTTFEVTVTNSAGPVTSNSATLTVIPVTPPAITTQPANQTVAVGQTATFSVVATGTMPLNYQWQQNNMNISNATSSTYTTPATTSGDNGSTFDVVVSNSAGSMTSNVVTLTVTAAPSTPSYGSGLTSTGITMNGGAAIAGSARLRLTDGGSSEGRSGFFNTPVNVQSFVSTFTFQLANANADGFTFAIQNNSPTALGSQGGGLGYAGIPNSVAVGFQLYSSVLGYKEVNLVGLWTNGAKPDATPGTDMSGSSINLHSGDIFKVIISYNGTTLSMYIRDLTNNSLHFFTSFPINIPSTVGGNTAYVGFTGGDGGLTATQDILSWSYSNSTGTSGTFIWPVDSPAVVGSKDYSTYDSNGQYHTGIDLCPGAIGCKTGDAVYASAGGTVQAVYVTSDPAQTMCDGSSTGSLPHDDNNHLGNTIIIALSNGKFSLYGNLDCVWPGIAPGVPVSQGARIGNIGNSQYGVRTNTWTPHLHFEIKDTGVINDPATGTFSSFTPDMPDGYGYHDPLLYLFPFSQTAMSPTAVKVVASPSLSVLTGPDTSYSSLAFVTTGQEFVAFASSGSWYEIYMPNSQGPISGWIPASAGSQVLAAPDSSATKVQVGNTGGAGLLLQPSASSATNLVGWVNNTGMTPFVVNCASSAKIWDTQFFVSLGTQNGFTEIYLPSNFYFSSGNTCAEPSTSGPSVGWASSSSLQ